MDKAQITTIVNDMWDPVFDLIWDFIGSALTSFLWLFLALLLLFLLICHINPFRLRREDAPEYLEGLDIRFLPCDLFRWWVYDLVNAKNVAQYFKPYGFSIFVGPQGAGKTTAMVHYLWEMKLKYPNCIIVTNFACGFADYRMDSWRDFLEIRNGEEGVIFAIDEIHGEYSSASWKDFPETILSQISMQRKQKIKIVATAQMFSRVAKPIREQAFSVMVCRTFYGRLTTVKEYDSGRFTTSGDSAYTVRKGVKPIWRSFFVQSNALRESFDTYEVIERMQKADFIPRNERGEQ